QIVFLCSCRGRGDSSQLVVESLLALSAIASLDKTVLASGHTVQENKSVLSLLSFLLHFRGGCLREDPCEKLGSTFWYRYFIHRQMWYLSIKAFSLTKEVRS